MRQNRHLQLVDQAIDACLSAIELYNKPTFRYREESFCILMINAWELLLKARILKENNNRMRSIEVWKPIRLKGGAEGKRLGPLKSRSGNTITIGVTRAAEVVRSFSSSTVDDLWVENISLLTEIRDNAVHFQNVSRGLQKRVQEIGTGSIRNFLRAAHDWFGRDLSQYRIFLMPLAFDTPLGVVEATFTDKDTKEAAKLLALLSERTAAVPFDTTRPFNLGIEIDVRFVRRPTDGAIPVELSHGNPNAIPFVMTDEQVLQRYPWRYDILLKNLRKRYSDFKANAAFYAIKAPLDVDPRFSLERLLDPTKKRTSKLRLYSPMIVEQFDPHYTLKV